ncbi:hypothetical protein DICPUDRAFT_43939 [Dictyostelium purpureum]|uniref:Thioredoxin domain-containing protein n=1 Tax=Dictyostelium purpureum TaxID=5786 RepID=F1A543_DICPU|nr:uncharacterized protein DICPUDRAFT_43939 [Dictyostelium purpureum]EGC28689.1 hypothetical protein DICPUDRAFT_43939 [Dictyostelium purpureum]|eukprot:XP_003294788.1 hypothetical protein DICPUDRAFT_43939 [Dictyostelium purpureum]
MPLVNKTVVTSPDTFESSLQDALNKTKNVVFVSFISSIDKTTCSLWCRDCQISEPIVNEAFEKSPSEITLVECQIEREG